MAKHFYTQPSHAFFVLMDLKTAKNTMGNIMPLKNTIFIQQN